MKNSPPDPKSSDHWALLATFSWLQEALLLRSRLESDGITVHIPEEYTAAINPLTTAMQVRILVLSSDLERAREFLALPPEVSEPSASGGRAEVCPACGSHKIKQSGNWFKNFLLVPIALLFAIPVRKSEHKICANCGHT